MLKNLLRDFERLLVLPCETKVANLLAEGSTLFLCGVDRFSFEEDNEWMIFSPH